MATVVTSFGHKGYKLYGLRFLELFSEHWPSTTDLVVYVEEPTARVPGTTRSLFAVPGCTEFIEKYRGNPLATGRQPTPVWRGKDHEMGYSFRTDAVKFARKVFAVADAARTLRTGILAWVDADAHAFRSVPGDLVEQLLGKDDVAYLGRPGAHSECGFLAFRLPQALPVIEAWLAFYTSGAFLQEREWHDSYLFDRAREATVGPRYRDLAPPGARGHVWFDTPLGQCIDHLKGDRKNTGFSMERRTKL